MIPINRHRSFAATAAFFEQFAFSHSIQFSYREGQESLRILKLYLITCTEPLRDNAEKHTARFSACFVQLSWKIDNFAVDCVERWSNDEQLWRAFPHSCSEKMRDTRNAVRTYLSCEGTSLCTGSIAFQNVGWIQYS
jgi:hypothetical protein